MLTIRRNSLSLNVCKCFLRSAYDLAIITEVCLRLVMR
jgi:hypothetical protein